MAESLFAGVMVAIALSWIARTASEPDGFVRHFSRGAFMRDLNKKIQEIPNAASVMTAMESPGAFASGLSFASTAMNGSAL
jgi:hypothetical protein